MCTCIRSQLARHSTSIFSIILHWNQVAFQDHLALDNSLIASPRRVPHTEKVPRKITRLLWVLLPLAYLVSVYALIPTGFLGPAEPRYASVPREMARSGDWITPR